MNVILNGEIDFCSLRIPIGTLFQVSKTCTIREILKRSYNILTNRYLPSFFSLPLNNIFISSQICSSLVLGTCYVDISGTTQRGVQDIRGFLWLITSEVCFSLSYNALFVFEHEMSLFKREVGVYRCSAYFVARFLSFVSIKILILFFVSKLNNNLFFIIHRQLIYNCNRVLVQ